ncbi:MAG: copper chaperone PCu(A)C [Zoogloeaceae bacterium]|jgi:copper(I)-binding protein|nr:copper chaperone PCu(A)C [Zoogloeaceae bacterium]
MKKLSLAILAACLSFGVWAGAADQITVVDPHVKMVPPNAQATGIFMVLKNESAAGIKLVKAESNAAKATELHAHVHEDGVMKMRQVPAFVVPANGEAVLKPGSLHIMLIGLTASINEGDKVALTLGFEDGSSKQVEAVVRKLTPMQPAH